MKRSLISGLGLVLIAVVFFSFNGLARLLLPQAQLDLTEHQLYTVSPGTRQILDKVQAPITLRLYVSQTQAQELPTLRNYAKRIEVLLRRYERLALGRVTLEVMDPEPFSEDEEQAVRFGLQGVPMPQGGAPFYLGLAATNTLGGTQVIPLFSPSEETMLEYDISRLLHTLSHPQRPLIGIMSTLAVEGDSLTPPWLIVEEAAQQFEVRYITPEASVIPADLSVLVLVHPKQLSTSTQYAVDQFVLGGGKLLLFVDPMSQIDTHAQNASSLPELFNAWGLQLLADKVVADERYAMIALNDKQQPERQMTWLNLTPEALNPDDISTTNLQRLSVATAGALEPLAQATTTFIPLIQSSESAVLLDTQSMGPLEELGTLLGTLKAGSQRYTLAARIHGPARSAFPNGLQGHGNGLKEATNINLIVVADTDMLSDPLWLEQSHPSAPSPLRAWADNDAFVINALDYLTGSDALISLRSRGRFSRPFEAVDELQRQAQARLQDTQQQLNQHLSETERTLATLRHSTDPHEAQLPEKQRDALSLHENRQRKLQQDLRQVQYELNNDIEALHNALKLLNIALVPLVVCVVMLRVLWVRHRRRTQSN